ncbi:MAG TPA: hypothetical protein VGC40_06330 [Paenirhodobacter sp.]
MRLILSACLCVLGCLAAQGVAAGPWPRAPGGFFAAISREMRDGGDWDALYAEYGLTQRLTFVLDAGRATRGGGWRAVAALRMPVLTWGRQQVAISLGAGLERPNDLDLPADGVLSSLALAGLAPLDSTVYPAIQTGISWGMGFDTVYGAGWATVDASLRRMPDLEAEERKLDLTLGLNLRPSSAVIGQIQYADPRIVDPQIRLGLGWVEHFGPMALEAGVGKRLRHDGEADVKVGLWVEF